MFCVFVSVCSLLIFLIAIIFADAAPTSVVIVGAILIAVGLLQYILYALHLTLCFCQAQAWGLICFLKELCTRMMPWLLRGDLQNPQVDYEMQRLATPHPG